MIDALLRDLRQPEYLHVLINPLPVYGLAVGLIGLLVAICQRSRPANPLQGIKEFLKFASRMDPASASAFSSVLNAAVTSSAPREPHK